MRQGLSILFIGILFTSVFAQGIIVVRYYANKAFIARELCENRSKPMLNCNGQCVLAKKLKAQEKQQEEQGISFTEKFEINCIPFASSLIPEPAVMLLRQPLGCYYTPALAQGFHSIFHPPDKA